MSIFHIRGLDPERWYVITRTPEPGQPGWREGRASLHGPNCEASIEWVLFGKHSFGWGFQLGRNGGESDVGLDLYAGRGGAVWTRLRAPFTKWARVDRETHPEDWYQARHTGLRIRPHDGCLISGEFESVDGHSRRSDPWWREWSVTRTSVFGRRRTETVDGDQGETVVPMPEGVYPATWVKRTATSWHVRWPGTWLDRITGSRVHSHIDLRVPGGIPHEGKGESSWDCGMDALMGCGGATVEDAVANAVRSSLTSRRRYGGPHDLPRPMTVGEAEEYQKTRAS